MFCITGIQCCGFGKFYPGSENVFLPDHGSYRTSYVKKKKMATSKHTVPTFFCCLQKHRIPDPDPQHWIAKTKTSFNFA
jgi:hypothetical protein